MRGIHERRTKQWSEKSVNDLQNDNGLEKEKKDLLKEVDGEKNISSKNMRNNTKKRLDQILFKPLILKPFMPRFHY